MEGPLPGDALSRLQLWSSVSSDGALRFLDVPVAANPALCLAIFCLSAACCSLVSNHFHGFNKFDMLEVLAASAQSYVDRVRKMERSNQM